MSKTARKKLHRLTGRVRRMLKQTDGMLPCDVLPDSQDISERLRREEAAYDNESDIHYVKVVASAVLESHKESCINAVREDFQPWIRKFNPYA